MPSSMPAMTVPGRLPIPPRTQIANTGPMKTRPADGSIPDWAASLVAYQ